jgi:hypothetical protein
MFSVIVGDDPPRDGDGIWILVYTAASYHGVLDYMLVFNGFMITSNSDFGRVLFVRLRVYILKFRDQLWSTMEVDIKMENGRAASDNR